MTNKTETKEEFRTVAPPPTIFKFTKIGETLEGVFECIIEKTLDNGDVIRSAVLDTSEDDRLSIALNETLSYYFSRAKVGDVVKITWKGKEEFDHPKLGKVKRNKYVFEILVGHKDTRSS